MSHYLRRAARFRRNDRSCRRDGPWLKVSIASVPHRVKALHSGDQICAPSLPATVPTIDGRLSVAVSGGCDSRRNQCLGWRSDAASVSPRSLAGMLLLQLFISIYGGYFGAGIGILMLSGLGLMGLSNMHQMNGIKAVLGTTINGVAAVVFIATQKVVWEYALAMMATSLVGGYLAAHYSRQIDSRYVRWLVIVIGFGLAAMYFVKTYG